MKKQNILPALCLSLLLTGCGWSGKQYTSVTPHREQRQKAQQQAAVAKNSLDLIHVLEDMIRDGADNGVIYIPEYPAEHVHGGMDVAIGYAILTDPLGAYAVEDITYEVGATGALPAMAVNITYRHNEAEIRQIRAIERMEEAEALVAAALEDYDDRLVMQAEMFFETDFQQMVRDYAQTYPEKLMEVPQVTVSIYGSGPGRVVELSFAYQTSRDSLRQMQSQVRPVFEAAELYVSGDAAQRQKFSQLYSFLMERFDYQLETSITPAYSLLHHGVGDSRAFATVYAAMCRRAGLECMVVTGTRSGEPRVWNIIQVGGVYQHLDLLQCNDQGRFQERSDGEMAGYVWDYSAYPECPQIRTPENTQPAVTESEETPAGESEETIPETQVTEPEVTTEPAETAPEETAK